MNPTRLIDATPIADDWRLIRLPWTPDTNHQEPAPGQWLWVESNNQRFCLPVRDSHAQERWIAGVMPAAVLPPKLGPGSSVHVSALTGNPARVTKTSPVIVIASDIGIGAALHFAEQQAEQIELVILGGQYGIPARLAPSRFYLPALSSRAIAGVSALESLNVPARIALTEDRPGVYEGDVLELLGLYLSELTPETRASLTVVSFMPWGRYQASDLILPLKTAVGAVQSYEFPAKKPA